MYQALKTVTAEWSLNWKSEYSVVLCACSFCVCVTHLKRIALQISPCLVCSDDKSILFYSKHLNSVSVIRCRTSSSPNERLHNLRRPREEKSRTRTKTRYNCTTQTNREMHKNPLSWTCSYVSTILKVMQHLNSTVTNDFNRTACRDNKICCMHHSVICKLRSWNMVCASGVAKQSMLSNFSAHAHLGFRHWLVLTTLKPLDVCWVYPHALCVSFLIVLYARSANVSHEQAIFNSNTRLNHWCPLLAPRLLFYNFHQTFLWSFPLCLCLLLQ